MPTEHWKPEPGLGVLVAAAKRAGTASLAIVCSDQKLSGLLALVGLDRAFAICT